MGNVVSALKVSNRPVRLILLLLGALAYYSHRKKSRSKQSSSERKRNNGGNDDEAERKMAKRRKMKIGKIAQQWLWKVFLPSSVFGRGSLEIVALVLFNAYRVFQSLRLTHLVRTQDLVIFNRNKSVYWSSQTKLIWLSVEMTFFNILSKYIEKRLGLIWKRKLTKILHEKYFRGANFYHVENELVDDDGKPTKDADSRMTEEVETVVEGYTEFLSAGFFNIFCGLFYLGKLWKEYGFAYAGAPFLYIYAARYLARVVAPLNTRRYRELAGVKAKYRNGQTRLVVHSEAISALRGGEREATILERTFRKLIDLHRKVHQNLLKHSMAVQFLVQKLLWCGCGWAIIGSGVFAPAVARSIRGISQVRAEVGYKFVMYSMVVAAALKGSRALTSYGKKQGNAGRIYELVQVLDAIDKRDKRNRDERSKLLADGERIAFENVDVHTPTSHLLVKSLSFDVERENDSLLLTGHNGAGKSSIFRCLAGLWSIRKGMITKPENAVFYLPQKPYNAVGTLISQMTYPEVSTSAGKIPRERLRRILVQVELEYLIDRPGAMTREINWDTELSLGEKQRLAIARVLWHNPRYCILDECTSGVSQKMERKLYYLLNKRGISYITISHRPILRKMHCKSLHICGDEARGYKLTRIQSPEELRRNLGDEDERSDDDDIVTDDDRKRSEGGEDASSFERERAERQRQRSAAYGHLSRDRASRRAQMERAFKTDSAFTNLRRLLRGAIPRGTVSKLVFIFVGIGMKSALADVSLQNIAGLFRALFTRDRSLLYRLMLGGVGIALAESAVDQCTQYVQNLLEVDLHDSLTKKFMRKYVSKSGYYALKNIDGRVTDPETRLSDDMDECVCMLSSLLTDVVDPVVKILWLGRRLALTIGSTDAITLYSYMFAAGLVARWIMPNFKAMTALKNRADGRLRYALGNIRIHSESIAFFGGGDRERSIAWQRFEDVLSVERSKLWSDCWFGWYKDFFVYQIPERLQQHLRFTFAVKQFSDDRNILADGGASLAEGQHQIWGIQNVTKRAIRDVVAVTDKFESLSGVISRLTELDVALDDLETPSLTTVAAPNGSVDGDSKLVAKRLDIVTPTGECLAKKLDLTVDSRNRLLVVGINASGKSSLVRVLSGMWPLHPKAEGAALHVSGKICFVPQRVYSVSGTLFDQVTYPQKIDRKDVTEAHLKKAMRLLEIVGIDYLVTRDGGWHVRRKFEDVLSLGEQQRLGMARLFWANPKFAVLDECTDAVSVDVEEKLYRAANERGINVITISKRLALESFHDQELRLGDASESGYRLRRLRSGGGRSSSSE